MTNYLQLNMRRIVVLQWVIILIFISLFSIDSIKRFKKDRKNKSVVETSVVSKVDESRINVLRTYSTDIKKLRADLTESAPQLLVAIGSTRGDDSKVLAQIMEYRGDIVQIIDTSLAMIVLAEGNLDKESAGNIVKAFTNERVDSLRIWLSILERVPSVAALNYETIKYANQTKGYIDKLIELSSMITDSYPDK